MVAKRARLKKRRSRNPTTYVSGEQRQWISTRTSVPRQTDHAETNPG
ncbi:hypothetical protein GCM10011410_17230 [Hoyosella rhizosphaerae]|uniref:Uncharacterized protein n=1 Tax=Hoyosella rhizosphaerae TaxID=1755582 RepID=A0A916XE92_9ACTN|nr:hypothetical protein GCM10011410_17230 [Hoyosella rhizosphaerae]